MRHVLALAVVFLFAVGTASAAVFEPVSDAQLISRADLIVVADVVGSASRTLERGTIVTDYRLSIRDVLKGTAGAEIIVTEYGGMVGERGMIVTGSAPYTRGATVLAMLSRGGAGAWRTTEMALGLFVSADGRDGERVFVRDVHAIADGAEEMYAARPAAAFVSYVRAAARGDVVAAAATVAADARPFEPEVNGGAASYAMVHAQTGKPVRWPFSPGGTLNYHVSLHDWTSGPDVAEAAVEGLDVWTNHTDSFITMNLAGPSGANSVGTLDGEDTIVFGGAVPNGVGTCTASSLACGVYWISGTHNFDGSEWSTIIEGDVVIRDGSYTQNTLDALVAHELGHSIGVRHSNEGTPSTSNALMNSSVPTSSGASLRQWDKDAMAEMYGNGIPCASVTSVSISGGGDASAGTKKTLTASHNGNGTFGYQWYRGSAGDTSQPVGTNSKTYETPPINEQMSFWVKVSNECTIPGINSAAVTVQPRQSTTCTAVAITTQPASPTVVSGSSATLSVAATGTSPITYQWYRGAVGDTSTPVGTGSTFVTPPLTATTQYWVRVSNTCGQGSSANSIQATVTVAQACVPPTIASLTPAVSLEVGSTTTLTVAANGTQPFTYQWYSGELGTVTAPIVGATAPSLVVGPFDTPGIRKFWVRVTGCNQSFADAGSVVVDVGCAQARTPVVQLPATVNSHRSELSVRWLLEGQLSNFTFEVQRSTDPGFTSAVSVIVDGTNELVMQTGGLALNTRHYVRVRAISKCNQASSAFSTIGSFVLVGSTKPEIGPNGGVLPAISAPHDSNHLVTQQFRLTAASHGNAPHASATETFTISTDQPWITVSPSSGEIPPQGIDITLTIDPSGLPVGASNATITIVRSDAAAGRSIITNGSTSVSLPLSFGKVTPVSPVARDASLSEATLIIPAVGHLQGFGTRFQSDVRLANASDETITYDLSFTPSGTNGLAAGKKTTVDVLPKTTLALDDIVNVWFGSGIAGEVGSGTLEIRPLRTASGGTPSLGATIASSRLFAIGPTGTLGQFIPALTQQRFITNSASDPLAKISLQQIAQSTTFRTNLGFVEGSGNPVSFLVKALDKNNVVVAQKAMTLAPFEHQQHSFAALFPNVVLADGRVEVATTSTGGKATAYASVLDNKTTDPLMVFPEQAGRFSASRYVVPGVAELNAAANFHTDMRIFNAAATPVSVTLEYFPQLNDLTPRPAAVTRTVAAGETLAIDNVLPTLWNLTGTGGSVVITTANNSSLVATARTYSRNAEGGTYGQFIPGVTAAEAVGLGERSLHVLQLEDSPSFRSNLGLFEVSGSPATVEVTAHPADGKVSPVTTVNLAANGFMQMNRILTSMGLPEGYNGRVSVRVVGGTGRVSAYGSVVDNRTQDPTYVPAQ